MNEPAIMWSMVFESHFCTGLTPKDGVEFLKLAPQIPITTDIQIFKLSEANEALESLRNGKIQGAAVLLME